MSTPTSIKHDMEGPEAFGNARAAGDRPAGTGAVEITYYTDPLCCWSWALEPQWRRLRYQYGSQVRWRYRMGGLIASWSSYDDPIHAISRPAQMGPLWMQAHHLSGMPVQDRIWIEDPPASSYPACVAVKAAEAQSDAAAELYLRRLREAIMLNGRNIARREVLLEVAGQLAEECPEVFALAHFLQALDGGAAVRAFQEDMRDIRYRDIARFPTLILRRPEGPGVMIVGYRPYEALRAALQQVVPDLQPVCSRPDAEAYANFWGGATERELVELQEVAPVPVDQP